METNLGTEYIAMVNDLKKIIDDYTADLLDIIYREYSVKDSIKHYFGRGEPQKTPRHKQFYDDIAKTSQEIAASLEADPDEALALEAVRTILYYGRTDFNSLEDNMRLAFISIEALSIPLLPFIKQEDAKKLCDDYAFRYPARERLPKQNELYYSLLERAGENVKKKWQPSDLFNDNHFFEKHGIKIPRPTGIKRK